MVGIAGTSGVGTGVGAAGSGVTGTEGGGVTGALGVAGTSAAGVAGGVGVCP